MKMELKFEWDTITAEDNFRKHGIHFEEAALVFDDPHHLSVEGRFENGEYQSLTIGAIRNLLIVLVTHHTHVEDDTGMICIISARRAVRIERRRYELSKI
jgi:uncharacterized protein